MQRLDLKKNTSSQHPRSIISPQSTPTSGQTKNMRAKFLFNGKAVIISPNLLPDKIWRRWCNAKSRVSKAGDFSEKYHSHCQVARIFCRQVCIYYNHMHFLGALFWSRVANQIIPKLMPMKHFQVMISHGMNIYSAP